MGQWDFYVFVVLTSIFLSSVEERRLFIHKNLKRCLHTREKKNRRWRKLKRQQKIMKIFSVFICYKKGNILKYMLMSWMNMIWWWAAVRNVISGACLYGRWNFVDKKMFLIGIPMSNCIKKFLCCFGKIMYSIKSKTVNI